jgi:hypothetical protein
MFMRPRNSIPSFLPALALALVPIITHAQSQPTLDWSLVDGIAGVSQNGEVAVVGTISPEDSGFMANGTVSFHSVFQPWPGSPGVNPLALQISHATSHITIRWSVLYPSNQIESASSLLGPTTTWTNVAPLPVSENGQWHLVLPADDSPRFFRLRLP